ncbi:MAG: hypothetical protein AAF357_04860 [Verrucomicrobiota bacterium]
MKLTNRNSHCSVHVAVIIVLSLIFVDSAKAQQLPIPEGEMARLSDLVHSATHGSAQDRLRASSEVRGVLFNHTAADEDVATVAGMLDLSLDRQASNGDSLTSYLEQIQQAGDAATRAETWDGFQNELNHRIDHILKGLETGDVSPEDLERLLNVSKYAVNAWDDFKDIDPVNGEASALFNLLNRLHGIAAAAKGIEDPSAKDLMEAFRNTLAEYTKSAFGKEVTNPSKAFELPAAVTAGIIDHNRKAFDAVTDVVDDLPAAMNGDPEALRRMVENSKNVESIISSEGYGRAIWDAMTGRIVDRIPFARTLAAWFGDYPTPESLAKWAGDWQTTWNDIRIHVDGSAEPIGQGLFVRRGGKVWVTHTTEDSITGRWSFDVINIAGDFEWYLTGELNAEQQAYEFLGFRYEDGKDVDLTWNGQRKELSE